MFILASKGPYTCVNCGSASNENVYKVYGTSIKSHHRSPSTAGTNISPKTNSCRLTECSTCHQYVDEYVQLDYNVLFLDAILQKHSFYRHILLNCRITHRSAFQMATAFLLCETFQRWTCLKSTSLAASKSYLQLELSFYLIFFCLIVENSIMNLVYFIIFKLFASMLGSQSSVRLDVSHLYEISIAIIVSSYGKLFFIPSYLYGGELRATLDRLVYLFFVFSLVQCTAVKGKYALHSIPPYLIVSLTLSIHYLLYYLCIVPLFQNCFGSISSDDYFLGIYLK